MPISLTPKQAAALRFIAGYLQAKDYSPSFDEIRIGLGMRSKHSVAELLDGLEERCAIRRLHSRARSIQVLSLPALPRAPDGAPLHTVKIPEAR
jgi:repressor LexA